MTTYTKAESFKLAVDGLKAQGRRSVVQNGYGCRYRGADGAKCFVGQLIDDEYYYRELEGSDASIPGVVRALELSGHGEIAADSTLLLACQQVHDIQDPSDWAEEYAALEKSL